MNQTVAPIYRAYLSEPITRCPVRERGRIQRLVELLRSALELPPYQTKLYIPSLVSDPTVRKSLRPEHVYLLDRIRIVEADYLLVLADHTSFGVGGEVEMATNLGKPIILFSREEKLSRFLLGTPANAIRAIAPEGSVDSFDNYYIHYRDWRDLKPRLLKLIESVLGHLGESRAHIPHWDISANLKAIRQANSMTQAELALKAGVLLPQLVLWEQSLDEIVGALQAYQRAGQLDLDPIELNSTQLEQLTNPSINALHKLAVALNAPISEILGDQSTVLNQKGPKKMVQRLSTQLAQSRRESLETRAFQFDVTFREYRQLRDIFLEVNPSMDDALDGALHQDRIPEEAFLKELNRIRDMQR